MLKARFFGKPQLTFGADSGSISLTGRIQALLTYLCVTRQPQDRNKLADLLWDHYSDQEAKKNLRYTIRDLRKAIGDYLVVDGQTIAFNVELPHWFDITSFTTYLAPNMRAASSQTDPQLLQELLNLYTGDFLAGFHIQDASNFERWMLAQRRHFHDAMVYGLQLAAQQHLDRQEYTAGLALNQYLLTLEPWREEAHRQRMFLLAASGQRSAALMQYELCCQILEEELDVPPMDETTSLYTQIKSGLWFVEQKAVEQFNNRRVAVRAYPQPASSGSATASAPAPVTAPMEPEPHIDLGTMPTLSYLIGRRKELCALQKWLDDEECRFAAILGLRGQGKSTLAAWFVQEQILLLERTFPEHFPAQFPQMDSQYVKDWPFPLSNGQEDSERVKEPIRYIIWRSLAQKPTCIELLQGWVQRLTARPHAEMPDNFDQLATMLFTALQQNRCLLILDGVDAILAGNTKKEQAEAEAYEQLFRLFIDRQHRSCLLLTSCLRPAVLTRAQHQQRRVHWLELDGLTEQDSEEFLEARGLETDSLDLRRLHNWYAGSPQLLNRAADLIHELFDGDVAAFSQEEIPFLSDIGNVWVQQLIHLSPLQKQILQLLAVVEQPLSRQALWEQLPSSPQKDAYYNALRDLQRAHWVRQTSGQFVMAALPAAFLMEHRELIAG